jgi:hypothetical protein
MDVEAEAGGVTVRQIPHLFGQYTSREYREKIAGSVANALDFLFSHPEDTHPTPHLHISPPHGLWDSNEEVEEDSEEEQEEQAESDSKRRKPASASIAFFGEGVRYRHRCQRYALAPLSLSPPPSPPLISRPPFLPPARETWSSLSV